MKIRLSNGFVRCEVIPAATGDETHQIQCICEIYYVAGKSNYAMLNVNYIRLAPSKIIFEITASEQSAEVHGLDDISCGLESEYMEGVRNAYHEAIKERMLQSGRVEIVGAQHSHVASSANAFKLVFFLTASIIDMVAHDRDPNEEDVIRILNQKRVFTRAGT